VGQKNEAQGGEQDRSQGGGCTSQNKLVKREKDLRRPVCRETGEQKKKKKKRNLKETMRLLV